MNFQLEIGNTAKTAKGGNGVAILLLHDLDKEDIGQGIFGYSKKYDGMGVYLNTILNGKTPGQNYIQGFVNDGEKLVNPMKVDPEGSCERVVRNRENDKPLSVKITHQNGRVNIEVGDAGKEQHCFTLMHKFERKFRVLLTGGTASYNPDYVYLHKAFLFDMRFPISAELQNDEIISQHDRQAQIDLERELDELIDIEE